jgi:hypothetical protein
MVVIYDTGQTIDQSKKVYKEQQPARNLSATVRIVKIG